MKNIYCIVGPSGVGKTTVTEYLEVHYGLRPVESYTTRPPRFATERGHVFLSDIEFDALGAENMVAYTEYNGFRYGVTSDVIDTHDLYVIDPPGVKTLLEKYKGKKGIKVIGLTAEVSELRKRMKIRGDSEEAIGKRIATDQSWFSRAHTGIKYDFMIHADGIVPTGEAVYEFIRYTERTSHNVVIYQINPEYDKDGLAFAGTDVLRKKMSVADGRVCVNMSIYDQVYEGDEEFLSAEDAFRFFNMPNRPRPWDYHSLSVSDIIEFKHSEDPNLNGKWFVDTFGFRRLVDDVFIPLEDN